MWDHFVLYCLPHQYLCGTTLHCISTYVGPLCIALFTCGTTLYCISTYVGPLCIALFTSPVPMWDHFVLYQYLCVTTLYCSVYLISTYVGPLCIAKVGMYLISRHTCMCDHFVLHCDCLPHQYLCGTTLYCISTYVGPLCIVLFTSSVPMWDHFCIASVPMWDHFVLHCLPHQYLCGTTLHCISTYMGPLCIAPFISPVPMWDHYCIVSVHMWGPLCIALFTSPVPIWTTLYCNSRYMPHQ